MAAFPPPALYLQYDTPLALVFDECTQVFTSRGRRGIEPDASRIHNWLISQPPTPFGTLLVQFEEFLNKISRHRGQVFDRVLFDRFWPTPHDALNYFKTWRTEIAIAVSRLPTFFDPLWLTGDVIALRDAIEGERAFDRLPILADALEEAGCDNPAILMHLREPYDHAHHCWVIDLLSCGTPSSPRPSGAA